MPVVRVFPGGSSGGFAGAGRSPDDGGKTRGEVKGWTAGSARRLVAVLWSIDASKLERDDGWALTLTIGEPRVPYSAPTSERWHAARHLFQTKLRRAGVELQQWVIEWTAKGVPHLHMAVYGGARTKSAALVAWLNICDANGWTVSASAQHIVPITGVTGWLDYVSKHASRGVEHYQRQGMPPGWTKTGRLWGISKGWPREEPLVIDLLPWEYYRYRRLVTAYRRKRFIALGMKPYKALRIGTHFGDKEKGSFSGVSGWIPDAISLELLRLSADAQPNIKYED